MITVSELTRKYTEVESCLWQTCTHLRLFFAHRSWAPVPPNLRVVSLIVIMSKAMEHLMEQEV